MTSNATHSLASGRASAATTSPTPRNASDSLSPRARSRREHACSPTGGSTPATTSPATSFSPSAVVTSPTSTNSPARSWTPTAGSARSGSTVSDREFAAGDRDRLPAQLGRPRRQERHLRNRRAGRPRQSDADRPPPTAARPSSSAARYLEAGNVRHAYALTGHAAQGLTVERAFVLGAGEARLQEWGYVALSRARAETRLYVTGNPREHESHFHDLDDRDPLARFGRALEESAVEELAVDQRPLPSGPRHDARPEIERSESQRRNSRCVGGFSSRSGGRS